MPGGARYDLLVEERQRQRDREGERERANLLGYRVNSGGTTGRGPVTSGYRRDQAKRKLWREREGGREGERESERERESARARALQTERPCFQTSYDIPHVSNLLR